MALVYVMGRGPWLTLAAVWVRENGGKARINQVDY